MNTNEKFYFSKKKYLFNPIGLLWTLIVVLLLFTSSKPIDEENFFSFFPIKKIASTVELNKAVSDPNPLTGETFTYTLQYRCASTVDDCIGTVITDPLPSEVEYVGLTGSPHTINEVYDAGTHTVTFTFQNILMAGSTGEVQIEVRYPNGVTPNGTVATNTATIDASNATPVAATISNTAFAEGALHLDKYTSTANAVGGMSTYEFRVCNTRYSGNPTTEGKLNLSNIYIIDTLPAGATLVQTHLAGGSLISYDPVTNIIEISVTDLDINQCKYPRITVQYSDPPYGIDTLITNTGYAYATPLGENEIFEVDSYTHGFEAPYAEVEGWKDISHSNLVQGAYGSYELNFEVMGTEQLDDFCIVDTIPMGVEITRLYHGGYFFSGLAGGSGYDIITIAYTTNLNPSQVITGSPFHTWLDEGNFIDVEDDLGLSQGGAEYITSISWCFGDTPVGFGLYENILLDFQVRLDAPSGIATNCMEFTTTTPATNYIEDCEDLDIIENTNGAIAYAQKRVLNVPPSGKYSPGDTVTFNLLAQNPSTAGAPLVNPEIFDLLPPELIYISGSWQIPAWSGNFATAPIFTETPNYNGTGRTLLGWSWTGASATNVPPDTETNIEFQAVIGENVVAGDNVFLNRYAFTGGGVTDCYGYEASDINDLNNNSNTSELLCFDSVYFDIEGLVSLESEKLVKGQMDSTYTKFPNVANSVPGGIADYILEVRNLGNLAMDSVVVIDIFPSNGDMGVIDTTGRDSRWQPNLVSTINAPAGVTVYYSLEENPCRAIEGFVATGPVGCATPNWSTMPPADLTTVRSVKFEFGSTLLLPQDTIQLSWAMRVPVNIFSTIGAQPDSIAWNSFGFIGRRTDNGQYILPSEPVKVGIDVDNVVPNVYGDFVWEDTNGNGRQNPGEPGINGVRVELFKDNGDGINNPAVDTFINFTLTANGGFYLFPNLPDGDYYSVFYKLPGMEFTLTDIGGNDAIDSDGVPTTINGLDVAITPIVTLDNFAYDLSWDVGMYPSSNGAIGNYIWNDVNINGIQDETPSDGINGITIYLFDNNNPTIAIDSVVTVNDINGDSGFYLFDNLPAGNYFLEIDLPSGVNLTNQGATGSSDPTDSDFNVLTNRTEVFVVTAGNYDNSWDGGLILSGTEVCDNGIDDDGDGLTDCDDGDCTDCFCLSVDAIGGKAFNDSNNNGLMDDNQGGLIGVEVFLFEDNAGTSNLVSQTTTDAFGNYSFTGVTAGASYRIEFVRPTGMIEQFTRHGADNGTNVQFVNAPSCDVNVGLANPNDYCEVQPFMYVSCYSFGAAENNPIDAIVGLPLNLSAGVSENAVIGSAVKHLANAEHVGSIYGMTYSKNKDMLYSAAFMKRHVGFGPGGTGAIYQIDPNAASPGASVLVDLNALFGANTAGVDPHAYGNTETCLGCVDTPGTPDNFNCWQYDTLSWEAVGTISLGDIDVSDDGEELFVMNLADKMLYRIDIDNPSATTRYAFPEGDISCMSGGEVRPFAVEFENGKVYVGAVCDQVNSSMAMLYVYELDLATTTWRRVLEANYQRNDGPANERFISWQPFHTYLDGSPSYLNGKHSILSDISFDNNAMVISIRDLTGDKYGYQGGRPNRDCGNIFYESSGDIFRAGYNSTTSQYEMEFDATVNGITTAGLNSGYGIAGSSGYSSYYYDDIAPNGATQITLGGLAQLPNGALYTSAYDITDLFDFGIAAYDNQTGARIQNYQLADNTNQLTGFGKANGLGALEFGCEGAPVEIGNRVWYDINENGIQDVTEVGLSGITIVLYNSQGDSVSTQITDSQGEYYFSDLTMGDSTLRPNETYYIVIQGPEYDTITNLLSDSLLLTDPNIGQAPNANINDSDALIGVSSNPSWTLDYPFIEINTGSFGDSNHNADFGFQSCYPTANPVTLTTCDNSNETGSGVFILHDANSSVSTASGITITYHPNLLDAQNNVNQLISPHNSSDGTVYARVEQISTGCFNTAIITLDVDAKCVESCVNKVDDDGDGLIDTDDPECSCSN